MAKKFKDHIWIWGHPTNSMFKSRGVSTVSPVDGVTYMNATNLVYNDLGEQVFDKQLECELAKDVAKVAWVVEAAAAHPENVTEIIEYAKEYKNITTVIWDDFFSPTNPENNYTNYTPQMMAQFREQLHAAGLDMWVVIYTQNFQQLPLDTILPFLKEFDGVSLWFWDEDEILTDYEKCVQIFFDATKGQRRMIGCYVYDFGGHKPATIEAVKLQLERGRELLNDGEIEGLYIHCNPCFGLRNPFEAAEYCKQWMAENGDAEI